ncbi:YwiC-like family protein [Gallibacterium anatis]|uniref:YwiC-like family protein n=1 Tax=Gallibacterium anatis TaxID=750 RepID=A0A930UXV9_9PAST|nr:YwiC-like family protein [Gallibacterium anatis]
MKPLISNQHGAIVMALLPFCMECCFLNRLVALSSSACLVSLYLMTIRFWRYLKAEIWRCIAVGHLFMVARGLLFAVLPLWYNPRILYF